MDAVGVVQGATDWWVKGDLGKPWMFTEVVPRNFIACSDVMFKP
jgi:hypothetical protein